MYYKVILFLSVFSFNIICSNPVAAKTDRAVTGKVIEKKTGAVLPYATVTIQSEEKSVLGGAYTAEDGKFKISNIEEGEKTIKVSFIGYKDTTITALIEYINSTCDLGTIELDPNATQLKAAVVTARVPVIEQKLDKIVMNVSEAVHTQGSDALEVLRKAPGVSVDPSGNILLNGQAVQIWIDNRPSNLTGEDLVTLLNSTDGSTIDKIEIMSHPSSKFDASGSGGIINIKTKKNFLKGLNGSVRLGYDAGYYNKVNSGVNGTVNLNYRSEKNNTFLMVSPRYNENFYNFLSETKYGNTVLESQTKQQFYSSSLNYKLGNDFYINKKNVFGFIVYGFTRDMNDKSFGNTGNQFYVNNQLLSSTDTKIRDDKSTGNISGNLNYSYYIKDGSELTLNFDHSYYSIDNGANQNNETVDGQGNPLTPVIFRSNSEQLINLTSFKADYEQIVWKTAKLETGFKVAQSYTDNDLIREDYIGGNWQNNTNYSSLFNYTETISAGYLSLAKQINPKLVAKAGLRAEYTDSKGNWKSSQTRTSKGYLDFFPNIYLGYTPSKDFRYQLSYSLRITRPNYNMLNPFQQYVDAQSSVKGNPDLNPEKTHEFTMSIGYKSNFNLALIYQQTDNKIIQNPYFNEESGEKLLIFENFGIQKFAGAAFSITEYPLTKWLRGNLNTFGAWIYNKGKEDYTSESFFSQSNAVLSFLLPKSLKFEVNAMFQTGLPYGYFRILPQGSLSLAVKKSFMNNKADLAININDIFNTQHERIRIDDYTNTKYKLDQYNKSRFVGVNFTYKFGQGKAARQRKVGVQDEASRVQ